jgi:hypothetical protein
MAKGNGVKECGDCRTLPARLSMGWLPVRSLQKGGTTGHLRGRWGMLFSCKVGYRANASEILFGRFLM